jgi:integrase
MQLRAYESKDGYACWLSESEIQQIIEYHAEDPDKQTALECLAYSGLRADELQNVCKSNIRQVDADTEAYMLRVKQAKRGYRETPLPVEVKRDIYALANARGLNADETVFSQSKRTYQRAVEEAVHHLAEEEDNEDWLHVSAHDLRRSWATRTYWRMDGTERALRLVMSWGGWVKEDTFRDHYLGVVPEDLLATTIQQAGLA